MSPHLHHPAPDTCEHGLPHIACGRCVEPHIRVIAVALPMLADLEGTLVEAGLFAEASITDGLCQLLAELVKSSAPPDSEEFAAAEAVLNHSDPCPVDCGPALVEALAEGRRQIEYLHGKFGETGSGNGVLARIDAALAKAGV